MTVSIDLSGDRRREMARPRRVIGEWSGTVFMQLGVMEVGVVLGLHCVVGAGHLTGLPCRSSGMHMSMCTTDVKDFFQL